MNASKDISKTEQEKLVSEYDVSRETGQSFGGRGGSGGETDGDVDERTDREISGPR